MPAIGRPDQGSNPFANIKKNPGPAVRRDENVGDDLNTITKMGHFFVHGFISVFLGLLIQQ